jgi:hypothetical protein
LSQPQRILLDAAMNEMGTCGKHLRENGWDAQMTVHTIPELHVTLTVPINVGPIPVEVDRAE